MLALSASGSVSARVDQPTIDRWLAAIKQSKTAVYFCKGEKYSYFGHIMTRMAPCDPIQPEMRRTS